MTRQDVIEFGVVIFILITATWLIAANGADLALSSRFYIDGGWPVGYQPFWQFFYRLNRWPVFLLGSAGIGMAIYSRYRPDMACWKRRGVFLLLLSILGPGVLVNAVFKDHWGRPRPRDVVEFGGTKQFLQPWQKGVSGNGRSFPSGHSSAAFVVSAPYFIYRRSNRRRAAAWLGGGLAFGVLMSIARITQGGHFLSDCLWSWGMVHLCGLLLAIWILKESREGAAGNSPTS